MAESVLDVILAHKREEVAARRASVSDSEIAKRAADAAPPRDFGAALRSPRRMKMALIAEIKKASPSAGVIRADFQSDALARAYENSGADCLSVLTDERFFQGHDGFLEEARGAVRLPVLRKDFVVDAWQIYELRALGADAVLLIAAALSPSQVQEYGQMARSLGMAALTEVHTEGEMEAAVASGAEFVGINSRDLGTFATDLGVVERLAPMAPAAFLVAESGLRTPADVARVRAAGARAVLVGETFMRAPDIGAAVTELLGPL